MQMAPSELQSLLEERRVIVVIGKVPTIPFTSERLSTLMLGDVTCTSGFFYLLFGLCTDYLYRL